jgi:hypothetical protein
MITVEVFIGGLFSLLVIGAGAFYWVMSEIRATRRENREENQRTRVENREENQRTRGEIQRVLEALYFHRHDQDGAAIFYPPTPSSQTPSAD